MVNRLFIAIISIPALVLGFPAATLASSGGNGFGHERPKKGDIIWEGLCVGASLDLSRASEAKCKAAARKTRPPAQPPSIEQGLCVGASLDLSAASARRCAHAVGKNPAPEHAEKDRQEKHHGTAQYAALGDSVAAGLGLDNPVPDDRGVCGRTFDSYVYKVAGSRALEIKHLACSGATLGDLFTEQGVSGPNIAPQLDGAFADGTPKLITITAGANDVRWQDFLYKCYAGTCGTGTDDQIVSRLLSTLDTKLHFSFREIERRSSGSPPEVILTGYYNPLSDSCAEIEPRLTLEEVTWLGAQTGLLNQTLENAASRYNFVDFAPIDFSGHDICSDEPWVQGLGDPAPFHPNLEGQQAIARAII